MIAVALDPAALSVAVAGRGEAAIRRFRALRTAGAADVLLFSDQPDNALHRAANAALRPRLPGPADFATARMLWIAGLPDDVAADLAVQARMSRVLVNVEDRPALCDFHNVAEVRRGDLLLTVSTGGASPGLAARIRARLASEYGPEWAERLALLRLRRAAWRQHRRSPSELASLTDTLLRANGWLA
jgi:precorrin-2 dehydrogenase/sirohydrochlorin ferrochelatase